MSTKSMVGVSITILVILLGAVLYMRNVKSQPASSPNTSESVSESVSNSQSVTVNYSDEGYSPPSLSVATGTTVVFTNNSTKSMWTASDPHPIHTGYAKFDARSGVANGQSYSFTFSDAGSFSFHNHLTPEHKGLITVE